MEGFLRGEGRPVRKVKLADADDEKEIEEEPEGELDDEFDVDRDDEPKRLQPPAWNQPRPDPEYVPPDRELIYVVDVAASRTAGVTLGLITRDPAGKGGVLTLQPLALVRSDLARLPLAADRKALSLLAGAIPAGTDGRWADSWAGVPRSFVLRDGLAELFLPEVCAQGRCVLRQGPRRDVLLPVSWDDGSPWKLVLVCSRDDGGDLVVCGVLRRGDEEHALEEADFLTREGLLLRNARSARRVKRATSHGGCVDAAARYYLAFSALRRLTCGESLALAESSSRPRIPVPCAPGTRSISE